MYEIDGIKFTKEELEIRAKELGITFEELLAKNSELIKQVGAAPEELMPVEDGVFIPEELTNPNIPGVEQEIEKARQDLTPTEQETKDKQEKIKSFDNQIVEYNDEIKKILNMPNTTGQQRLEMVNQLPVPESATARQPDVDGTELAMPDNEDGSTSYVENEYTKRDYSNATKRVQESENKEETYSNLFNEFLMTDPLVDSRRNFYVQNVSEKVEAFKQELVDKNVYDLSTREGVDAAQRRVNEYYASLIDESMQSDPVVLQQAEKISEMLGIMNTAENKREARGKSLVYSLSDFGQAYYGKGKMSDIIAGIESLAVSTQALTSNSMDVIGAQVDGMRIKNTKDGLAQLEKLTAEGRGDDEEVKIKIGEKGGGRLDSRPELTGTIKQLREELEKNLQEGSQSLEENITQMQEFEEYRALAEQAKFSDGISFRDIMVGLGGSIPQMTAASAGAVATFMSGGALAPIAGALTLGGGAMVTTQFYGENYIEGVKEGMLADPEKYPDGITEKALGEAIASGEYDNIAQDLATAAFMSRLEKLGAETTMKAFFKSMGVSYKSGVKSLFRGDIKKIIKNMGKGVVKQTPNSLIEGLTEVGQSTLQALNTGAKQGDLFKYVNGEQNWEEFLAGVTIGTVLPFGGAVGKQTITEIRSVAMQVAKEFNPKGNLAQTEMFYKKTLADLKKQKDAGNISEQDYHDKVETISTIRNAGLKVPGSFSKRARAESLDLMVEKADLLKEIDGLDSELTKPQQERIKKINQRLNNIGKAEDIINKNKKISKQLADDVIDEFKTFENEEEMKAFLEENGLDPSLASGRAVEVKIDGKEIALVNTEKMTDGVGYFAGAHEILHKFLKKTLRTNPESVYQMANVIKDRLKVLSKNPSIQDNIKIRGLNSVLNQYKRDSRVTEAKEAEELITLFSEFVDLGLIAKDKKLGDNLLSSSRRLFQDFLPNKKGKIQFNNANDILNFIADYNKSINKGRLTRAQRNAAEQGIEISDDLSAAGLEFDKERVVSKEAASQDASLAKDLEIEQAQQRNASAAELASLFEDDVRRYVTSGKFKIGETAVKDNPKVAGTRDFETGQSVEGAVEIDDIVSDILYSKRGVVGLVEDYYKKSKEYRDAVTLGQFIGDSRRRDFYRATEIVAPLLGVQSQEQLEEKPKQDFSKEEKQSLRQSFIELGDDLGMEEEGEFYNKVIEKTKRTLGTRLGDVSSGAFLKALRKSAIADLETEVKKIMGTPTSAKYKNFVETYVPAILAKSQQTTLNKRLNGLTEPVIDPKTGKQARTLTEESRAEGSRVKDPYAGNPKRQLKPGLTTKDLTNFFINTARPDARRNSLAKVAAIEFTEDALRQVLDSQVEDSFGRQPGSEGYVPTTLAELRAEKFGRDNIEAEIAFIARDLGRGENYSFAKDIVLEPDDLSAFMLKANELVDIAYTTGYRDEDGNYKPEFQEAIEGLDDNVIKAIDMLLEEDPMLEQGGEFVKVNKKFLSEADENLLKQINNKDHIITSKIKGKRTINKAAAKSLNNFAQRVVKIVDSGLIGSFNESLEFLGFSNRLLDPAKQKEDGSMGAYFMEYIKARSSKFKKENNVNTKDVIPMNKDFTKVKNILKPMLSPGSVEEKLSLLKEKEQKIKDANIANIELFKTLMLEIQKDYQNGKKITPLQLFQFFQLQTSAVKGLRALSGFDYLYLIDGNQDIESFKNKRLSKDNFLKLDEEQQDASIQEFIDEFPEFKGRYDIRLKQNINAIDEKTGKKKYTLEEAKAKAAFGTKPSAYVDLITKGEHLVPNSITMTELFQGMLKGTLTDASLDKILSGHTQFFGPNYVTDLIDAKGIEGGPKIALTSPEGILRLTKFLKNQTGISNNIYSINGEKAYKQILQKEIFDKKVKILEKSVSQAKDIDVDLLKSSGVLEVNKDMSMEEVLSKAAKIDKALRIARNPNAPVKKIRVFDFDDTLATSNNIVIATSPDGVVKELNAEEFAAEGFDLKNQGYDLNFDDFNNVTDGARGPLFDIAQKIKNARGTDDVFVLTARAPQAAPAIYEFLKSQGLEIPLKNITGLGNSTGEAKANWIIDKAAEGYNDFYFADDAAANVAAVKESMNLLDVKSKTQLVKKNEIKFSKESTLLKWEIDDAGNMKTTFNVGDKKYNFNLDARDSQGSFDVEFDLDGRQDITGTGDSVKVIKTVYNGLLNAIGQNKNIKKIEFSAKKSEPSRVKLYTTLMNNVAERLGWETDVWESNDFITPENSGYDFEIKKPRKKQEGPVEKVLDVVDVKSEVQQASQAKDLDLDFNDIIEQKTGVAANKEYSKAKAQVRGSKRDKFQFFIPYSAEDFTGLIYPLLSKGKLGDSQLAWFKKNLFDPFSRGQLNLQTARLNLMQDFKKLKEDLNVPKDLNEEAVDGFTNEQAVRVYLWTKQGLEVPGLSKTDTKELNSIILNNPTLKSFADQLLTINKSPYPSPLKDWLVGNITTDLMRGLKETKRPEYLQEWQDNVDIIFSEKNLNKLEAAYGARYREAMENILKRMKSGSNRLQEGNRLSNRILNYINGSNAAIMFFNTRSAILQTISSINFLNWDFNNPLKAGAAFANQPQYWKDFMTLMNSDFLKDRRNGLRINITESEIADAANTSKNKAKGVLNYILSKGYAPTQYADSFAIASGGATFYRNRINDLMKKGFTEAEAKQKAMEEFMEKTEENQQSSRPDKISQQQSSDYGRLILMFANTPMQYARLQKRAIQDLTNGRGDSKANVSKIIYYGVVQNIIFNALQQAVFALGFGDDEEDEKKSKKALDVANGMADSLLRGLGVAGAATSVVKNFLLDIYERSGRDRPEYVDSIYKLLQFSPPIGSKISRIRQATWQFDSKKRRQQMMDEGFSMTNPAFLASAKVVSATTNIPLDRILLKYDNLSSIMDEDTETWQKIALASGWPKWTLETKAQRDQEALNYLIKDPKGYSAWEQKSILKQFGLKSYEIKRFKNEESRVKEILRLQNKNNKNFQPLESDKPETREEKAARKAEILRKAIEKRNARN